MKRPWRKVVLAGECPSCPDCGEPWCRRCRKHYADCSCPGPSQADEYEYRVMRGAMYARKMVKEKP